MNRTVSQLQSINWFKHPEPPTTPIETNSTLCPTCRFSLDGRLVLVVADEEAWEFNSGDGTDIGLQGCEGQNGKDKKIEHKEDSGEEVIDVRSKEGA